MLSINREKIFKIVFLVSLISLISAYFIEYVLGHQPCNLCLIERIPYASALVIIFLSLQFSYLEKKLIFLLIFVFLTATFISLYHLGIEQGFIQESFVCDLQNSSKMLNKEEILKELQKKSVSCKDVTFKIFGLSLTTLNIMISLVITIIFTRMYLSYEKNR